MERTERELVREGLALSRSRFDQMREAPVLQQLFFEVTQRCNLSCLHCASRCDKHETTEELSLKTCERVMRDVSRAYPKTFVAITGGEPCLRDDLEDIGRAAARHNLSWGMTTNATLIDDARAQSLADAGLVSVSVSIDGTEDVHDRIRRRKNAYRDACTGIYALANTKRLETLGVTTVVNHATVCLLDDLFDIMCGLPIDHWRIVGIEPSGSALEHPELMLTREDHATILDFIRAKREDRWPVSYGCCHYLGLGYEGAVRDWFWFCNAGLHVMSITHDGAIASCLDIERRPETTFGSVYKDDVIDIWRRRFETWRKPDGLATDSAFCDGCEEAHVCRGDSAHSWDYDKGEPRICMKRDLKEFVSSARE